LYDWQHPRLPEDLSLLREANDPWLGSIAHESDGFFLLNDEERRRLFAAVPRIREALTVSTGVLE
jgi:hypothetical protein